MRFWKQLSLAVILTLQASTLLSQNPALLEQAFQQNSDALLQSFLRSCDATHRKLPPRRDTPADARLQPLLAQASSDVDWAATTAFGIWKLHPIQIPVFELPKRGRSALSEMEPVMELDLRFLALPDGKQVIWIDRELDSMLCHFLDADAVQASQTSGLATPNPRRDFLQRYIPFHHAHVISDSLEIREQDFDLSQRPYCNSAWNHGMEPMFSAVITKGKHRAVIVLNQFDRVETMAYYRIGRRWHLLERQGASEVSINCLRPAN